MSMRGVLRIKLIHIHACLNFEGVEACDPTLHKTWNQLGTISISIDTDNIDPMTPGHVCNFAVSRDGR